jgi:hypothetical protein
MGKINQIQITLKGLSEGKFQKLADAYLVEKRMGIVNSVGSVIGADKTRKGRPDTLITLPNGNYALAEFTTQQTELLDKLKKDLRDCFVEEETGVPIEKIDQVILCFNSKLNAPEVIELQELAEEKGAQLFLFGIDAISHDINQYYPGLARQYLDLELDTGQIVSIDEFVSLHSREKMAAGIDQSFFFRVEELGHLLSALEQESLIIITGGAGVGKTRLALELSNRFIEQHTEYQMKCVFGRNRDFWNDLQVHFNRPGKFIILVDDANRLSRFDYVVDLLLEKREDREIKVVATVREYALQRVSEIARKTGEDKIFAVKPFTDEQISEFLREEFGIKNFQYIKRIVDIVKGNPRLAVMAARAALEGDFKTIRNVTDLYEDYFSSIKDGLLLGNKDINVDLLIQVIAIISLFEAVDYSYIEMMAIIENTFGINSSSFWEASYQLHDFELVDMYEKEVVRVQDQVLGTYCFHRAFFVEESLDFGLLIRNLFPRLKERIVYSINSASNAFDGLNIIEVIQPNVKKTWTELEKENNIQALLELIDTFGITDPTRTQLWAKEQIDSMEHQPAEEGDILVKGSDSVPHPSVLSILSRFADVKEIEARVALDLLMQYLQKRPGEFSMVLSVVTDEFGYDENSYYRKYDIQHAAIDVIWERTEIGEPLFSWLFLEVASKYLETHVQSFRDTGKHRVEILEYILPITPELYSLREKIWHRQFRLYEKKKMQDGVLIAINKYLKIPRRDIKNEVVKEDMKHVFPFLENALDVESYQHCIIGNEYLDFLEAHGIDEPEGARDKYKHETYELAEVLLTDWGESRELELSHEEYQKRKLERLGKYTEDYVFDDYVRFFKTCDEIRNATEDRKEYQLSWGMSNALLLLANRDHDLCAKVLECYFNLADPIRLNGYPIINSFIEQRGPEEVFTLFMKRKYRKNKRWLFCVYELIPADNINKKKLKHLYRLYRTAKRTDLPQDQDYLIKYIVLDPRVVAKVVSTVMKKAKAEPAFAYALIDLFNPHKEVAKNLPELFAEDIDLLKQAYLCVEHHADLGDHKGKFFAIMMDLDREFIIDYIDWKYKVSEKSWLSSHDIGRDYSFIWDQPDYLDTFSKVVDHIFGFEQASYSSLDPLLGVFFGGEAREEKLQKETIEKQDDFLLHLIEERSKDGEFMRFLFRMISYFSPGRRRQFVEQFVKRNKNIEEFRRLNLEPSHWSWSGSQVSLLQGRVEYWESLLPVMDTADLLQHKQHIEHHIQGLKKQIEQEMKSDFIEDR